MALSASTFLLVILFGSAAWMGTNSIWMQLPLVTSVLPEAWNLPSFLAAVVQIACIGPLVYGIFHKRLHAPTVIVALLVLLLVCSFLLIPFWDVTAWLGTQQYSLVLYALMFGIALVNSTSNVLFMPFMAQFHPAYLNAYFGGMGLSSLVPSVLSLAQGSGNYECVRNGTAMLQLYHPARFSVSVFFSVVAGWTALAAFAFVLLYWTGAHKKHRQTATPLPGEKTYPVEELDEETPLRPPTSREQKTEVDEEMISSGKSQSSSAAKSSDNSEAISGGSYYWILGLTALVNAQMNGIIPSIHSYAALPYSQTVYHLGLTLSNIVAPLASFAPFLVQTRSVPILTTLSLTSSFFTALIVYLASRSPDYLFGNYGAGAGLAVVAPILAAGLHSFLRTLFASVLREGSHGSESRLFWCGVFIQIGSFVGSAVMFPLVNFAKLFEAAPACRP
ncbi:unnamed protein product, partial [Mesorhabditis spiculigera]